MNTPLHPLYGVLLLPHLPAQASLRVRPELAGGAVVILEGKRPQERLFSANQIALSLGLTPGMTRIEVESFPLIHILPRSPEEERAAAELLPEAISLFTPHAEALPSERPDWECILDLSGAERLLGAPDELGRSILAHLGSLGFTARIALAENPDAGLSLARAARQPVTSVAAGHTTQALAPLPLYVLNLSADDQDRFASWGIRTLGELAALPEHDLISRLGQAGKRLHLRARGELPHLLQPAQPGLDLSEFLDLEDPIETLEPLLFCIHPMLEQILLRAQSRTLALAAVTISLTLFCPADRALDEAPAAVPQAQPSSQALSAPGELFSRTIRPAIATVDRRLLLKMLQLDLEANPPPGAIVRLHLAGEPGAASRIQLGLFAPPMPEPTRFEDTHARLVALVGEGNVGRLRPLDTHAAESFTLERFKLPNPATTAASPREPGCQPATALRRLRPAVPVCVQFAREDRRNIETFFFESRRFEVLRCYGPWRSSGDWWRPSLWSEDTWDLAARAQDDGELLLCVVAHDLLQDRWQMEAIYD